MKIDREAIQFFCTFIFIGVMIIVFARELAFLSYVSFFLSLFTLFFFRDPKRKLPQGDGLVLSPADGKIIKIEEIDKEKKQYKMVSIFMSVFNVHINRSPVKGMVKSIKYSPGGFLPAFRDKASLQNEQTEIVIIDNGAEYIVRQIAGLIARRIVVRVKEGESLEKGQRIGLIRFGSRVDLFLPLNVDINVRPGQSVKGGKSVIGEIK